MHAPDTEPLVHLGFTALESQIYSFLLTESPATGYRVAQALGKPAPNIYKAIESLATKGAIMVDEGTRRQCRPIPPDELISNIERRFHEHTTHAAQVLTEISSASRDDRIYQLKTPALVLERCRAMLGRAREVALIDIFPASLEDLRADLEACAARGVLVAIKVYRPTTVAGAHVACSADGETSLERWPARWITIVVDGSEHLVACMTDDGEGVHQAVWSGSVYLSWVYHSAIASEITLEAIINGVRQGASNEELSATFKELRSVHALDAAGYRKLMQQLGRPESAKGEASYASG